MLDVCQTLELYGHTVKLPLPIKKSYKTNAPGTFLKVESFLKTAREAIIDKGKHGSGASRAYEKQRRTFTIGANKSLWRLDLPLDCPGS